jgi:heptosyltransferase III
MSARAMLHRVRDAAITIAGQLPLNPISVPKQRIVLVRPDHFGDLLMLGPALQYIRERAMDHELFLMTGPWNKSVAEHIAARWKNISWPFPGFERGESNRAVPGPYRQLAHAASMLREQEVQTVVLTRDDHWWGAWMAREAGIPVRIGYDHSRVRTFLTHPLNVPMMNYAQQNLEVARRTLAILGYRSGDAQFEPDEFPLRWPVEHSALDLTNSLLRNHDISERFAVVHPGSGAPAKLWPLHRWAHVIDRVVSETDTCVLLTGSPDERDLCDSIAERADHDVINLAGETSLFALGELMRKASLVLGVDSGPLHLAVAVGTPSIHLYGPSDHVRYGPWGSADRHLVLRVPMKCPDCGNLSEGRPQGCGCMTAITTDNVANAAIEMMSHER